MILTVGLELARRFPGVEEAGKLPEPPALQWSGFLVSCDVESRPLIILNWIAGIKRARPAAPVALVVRENASTDLVNLAGELGADPVVRHSDAPAVAELIDALLGRAIASRIADGWIEAYDLPRSLGPHLRLLAEVGMAGGRVARACKRLTCSPATLYRTHTDVGLPSPAFLLREARVLGVELRCRAGTDRRTALELADWRDERAFASVRRRTNMRRFVNVTIENGH